MALPEIRLNQDLNYKQRFGSFDIGHRYRIEERFMRKSRNDSLVDGYNFIKRLSYQVSFEYNLFQSKKSFHSLALKASEGISINASKSIVYNTFDRNSFYVGINYQALKIFCIELGYNNLFQQRSSGNQFYNRHIVSLSINHKLKLNK